MTIVVNDANILIDLVKLQLLPHFFGLELDFHTSDIILDELHQEQAEQLKQFIENGTLKVISFTAVEMIEIAMLQAQKTQLSEQDCSAVFCAQRLQAELLTSDNNLRHFAKAKKIIVHGHLWVFDQLVSSKVISGSIAIQKLTKLINEINPRLGLPKQECEARIKVWNNLL